MQSSTHPSVAELEAGTRRSESMAPQLDQQIERYFDREQIERIAERHDLTAYVVTLQSTLKNAGKLYLQYSARRSRTAHDLAPKCRTVARVAEMARTLAKELNDLDFWDRWQIFQHLESTGHPLAESMSGYTKGDPLIAGNMVVEEIQLILNTFQRYESDFFAALTDDSRQDIDIGLYFFTFVMAGFWEGITGENLVGRGRRNEPSQQAITFLQDCLAPLDPVDDETIKIHLDHARP